MYARALLLAILQSQEGKAAVSLEMSYQYAKILALAQTGTQYHRV